jgi:hypothetical protein
MTTKKNKNLKDLIEEGIVKVGEELNMPYRGIVYKGTITKEGRIKTDLGTFSVTQSAINLMLTNPEYNRKKPNCNGWEWWDNKDGIRLDNLRNGTFETPGKKYDSGKNLKWMIDQGILKENEEIYLSYRGVEYTGRATSSGKIKTVFGEFSVCKSLAMMIQSHPDHKKRDKFGSGYIHWKNWKGTTLRNLRKNSIL